jgi:hypothetical protein
LEIDAANTDLKGSLKASENTNILALGDSGQNALVDAGALSTIYQATPAIFYLIVKNTEYC